MDKSKINMIIVALLLAVGVWWFFLRGPAAGTEAACDADGGKWTAEVPAVTDADGNVTTPAVDGFCTMPEKKD